MAKGRQDKRGQHGLQVKEHIFQFLINGGSRAGETPCSQRAHLDSYGTNTKNLNKGVDKLWVWKVLFYHM